MSQDFEFDMFEERQVPSGKHPESSSYSEAAHVRNLCFKWPDGRCVFYNYAYLISGGYEPENQAITLTFTTQTVVIEGSNLQVLFDKLFEHSPKSISCNEGRYSSLADEHDVVINRITVIQA